MVGPAQQQETDVTSHVVSTVRKQRDVSVDRGKQALYWEQG